MPPQEQRQPPSIVDALIVGGGPAGLTCAFILTRNLHTVIVFDHGLHPDRVTRPPWDGDYLSQFRFPTKLSLVDSYNTLFLINETIKKAAKNGDGIFEISGSSERHWKGRSLVLAGGVVDVPVEIPGFEACRGHSIYQCLPFEGYEQRGNESSGVLALQGAATILQILQLARNAAQLTKSVTIYTNGNASFTAQIKEAIGLESPFTVDDRRFLGFERSPEEEKGRIKISFLDGSNKWEAFLTYKRKIMPASRPLMEQLGLRITPENDVEVKYPYGETSLSGCFAAGDNSSPVKTIANAVGAGFNCAIGVSDYVQCKKFGHKYIGSGKFKQVEKEKEKSTWSGELAFR
ncbi:FAD/NAD(P)-binding domain-containing protein [Nemania sp. FL0916]|nr:FAD/NAD(P)-binding domain-containing protein [Nemania sp. FL0916]